MKMTSSGLCCKQRRLYLVSGIWYLVSGIWWMSSSVWGGGILCEVLGAGVPPGYWNPFLLISEGHIHTACRWEYDPRAFASLGQLNFTSNTPFCILDVWQGLKDPSHLQCFARIEWEIRHFLCHLKSGFFHSELKSGYIRANTASLGLHLLFWP